MGWFDGDSDDEQEKKKAKRQALPSLESIMAPSGSSGGGSLQDPSSGAAANAVVADDDDPLEAYMKSLETVGDGGNNVGKRKRTMEFDKDDGDDDDNVNEDVDHEKSASDSKDDKSEQNQDSVELAPFRKGFWKATDTQGGHEWRKQHDVHCSVSVDPILSFEEMKDLFGESLLETIHRKGYESPTLVQSQTLSLALSGHDALVTAATGQGKTLSFIWPLVVHIVDQPHLGKDETGPIGLCLVPTRELATQVFQQAKIMLKPFGGSAKAVIGGQGKYLLYQELKKSGGVEIVVATPGRLLDVCSDGKKGMSLKRVTFVVLDEADKMLSMGFEVAVRTILSSVRKDRQILMFSATMGKRVEAIAKEWLSGNYVRISVGKIGQSSMNVEQNVVILQNDNAKETFLLELLPALVQVGRTLVFVATRERCEELALLIRTSLPAMKVATLHGDKHQSDRSAALRSFSRGDVFTMVSTDLAGRGLDVENVKTVVCFDVAKNLDSHTHRIGRAGRLSAATKEQSKGTAYTLLTHRNADFAAVLKRAWEREGRPIPNDLLELANKSRRHGFGGRQN